MQRPPFTALAGVYDAIMADIEYPAWADFILMYARDGGLAPRRVLDLACGTGGLSRALAARGLEVTGLDASEEMLSVARRRLPELDFVPGDLRDFALPGRFDLITCVFDSLNNLTRPGDLGRAFARVQAHLAPGGLFAFDVNTREGVRDLWEGGAIEGLAVDEGGREVHYHWSHHFDAARGLGVVQALCRLEGEEFIEVHEERGYDQTELEPLLSAAGFERWEFVEFPDYAPPEPGAPRVWAFAWAAGAEP